MAMRLVYVLLLGGLHPRTPARAPVGRCPVNGARFALLLALLVCLPLRSGGARPAPRPVGLRPPFGGGGRCRHSRGVPRPAARFRNAGSPAPLLPALATLGQSGGALRAALFSACACPQNGFFSASIRKRSARRTLRDTSFRIDTPTKKHFAWRFADAHASVRMQSHRR